MIVISAFEERNSEAKISAQTLKAEFKNVFFGYLSTFHPDGVYGESRTKGANATWAAKSVREFLSLKGILESDVVVSCFDSDTCVDKEYFGCLTYNFLITENPKNVVLVV